MAREKSDIVRDRIIEARDGGSGDIGNKVILTDDEACDIWSALSRLETEVRMMKSQEFKALQDRFHRIQETLKAAKKKLKQHNLNR